MFILEANCQSPMYSVLLYPLKNIMTIILIAAPILLMISLAIILTKLVISPKDTDKKISKQLFNSVNALLILFSLSVVTNVVMMMCGSRYTFSECWNKAKKVSNPTKYYDIYEDETSRKKMQETNYQQGKGNDTDDSDSSSEGETSYKGKLPTDTSSRTTNARNAAVNWAINIANDDTFHYGQSKWAHHHGCYFCKTNQKSGSAKLKDGGPPELVAKSYCCNPFVTAAFHHGAGTKEVDCKVGGKRINLANDSNKALNNPKAFQKISKPSKVTDLVPGDVLLTPTHAMLYVGGGKVAEASGADDGIKNSKKWNKSIRVDDIGGSKWKKVTKIYRYIGTGRF